MRVLHVTATFDRGGIAVSLWHLLPQLARRHNAQIEIGTLHELGVYGRLLTDQQFPAHEFNLTHKYDWRGVLRLAALIRRERYTIVHAHGWPAVFFVALASHFTPKTRYVLTEHNVFNRRRLYPALRPFERWMYGRYAKIIAVSQVVADALKEWLPETADKTSVIHNGVDITRLRRAAEMGCDPPLPPRDGALILAAGTLEPRKGIDVLLTAVSHLRAASDITPPTVMIAGDGQMGVALRELRGDFDLQESVIFAGFRSDMAALMAAADLFVLPSRWEGCPMVVLEAMALGKPVAATAVGGVPELVQDGETGLLVPSEDAPQLAEAMLRLLRDPQLRQRLGQAARQRAETLFAIDQIADRTAAVYRSA